MENHNKSTTSALSSYTLTIVLLALYAFILAVATFVEKYYGTVSAKTFIYYSPVFFFLQFLLVVNFFATAYEKDLLKQRRIGMLLTHFSFCIILLGALISHFTGIEGHVHLREGEETNKMEITTSRGNTLHDLPFSVKLIDFTLTRYPGSSSPSSYESNLLVNVDGGVREERVYMNNVLDLKGYRFFQASYDTDERGTILSVNKDVVGRNVTYTGYFLLFIGFILIFFDKKSRFRRLSRKLKSIQESRILIIFLFLGVAFNLSAKNDSATLLDDFTGKVNIDKEHAARFGKIPVQSTRGRIIPMNTFSSEILRKVHKAEKIGNYDSDQFLLSLLTYPEMWMRIPFILAPNKEVVSYFHLTPDNCSYLDVFDEQGQYKLQAKVEEAYSKEPGQRNAFEKEIIKLDERINILHQILGRQLIAIFPYEGDVSDKWYAPGDDLSVFAGEDSVFVTRIFDGYLAEVEEAVTTREWSKADEVLEMITTYQSAKNNIGTFDKEKIEMEVRYNKMEIFRYCKIFYLILGGIFILIILFTFNNHAKWTSFIQNILVVCIFLAFLYQTLGMGIRWYIGGYAPWSNSYETMIYVAWATVLGGLLFVRRSTVTLALATLFAGIILFVSGLNWMDPQINPLVPVLKSPWLMFHVAVIVAAYGFFGISFLIGITNQVLMTMIRKDKISAIKNRIQELSIINEMSLIIGLVLLTIGTFLGAIWANESWGRYWGWDPKETWALITMIIYAIVIHLHLLGKHYNLWIFNLLSVLSFASVLMTFFGVNYFLSGMHSYGSNENIGGIFIYLFGAALVILMIGILSYKGKILK